MIPLLAMFAIGFISVVWPGPKLDLNRHESGAIFAPQFKAPTEGYVEVPDGDPSSPFPTYTKLTSTIESKRPE